MRLHHSPEGSTYPRYKLMCFAYINFFREEQNALAFHRDTWCHLAINYQNNGFFKTQSIWSYWYNLKSYRVRYLSTLLYKWDPATEFTQLGSTPFKDSTTLMPKLADLLSFWRSSSTPFKYWIKYSWSGSTHILYYINCQSNEIHYLETTSRHVNTSFIIESI